jgi:hypothetical protein
MDRLPDAPPAAALELAALEVAALVPVPAAADDVPDFEPEFEEPPHAATATASAAALSSKASCLNMAEISFFVL